MELPEAQITKVMTINICQLNLKAKIEANGTYETPSDILTITIGTNLYL